MNDAVQIPGNEHLARHFVLVELHETATLLTLIVDLTATLRSIRHTLDSTRNTERPRSIEIGSERASLLNQFRHHTSQLRVLLKALYEWLYHLQERLKSDATLKGSVPAELWSRLDRYCTFRNKLITHKESLKHYGSSGLRFDGSFSKIEMLMVPEMGLPDLARGELDALFELAMAHLEAHEAKEQNVFERMAILYRCLDRFPGDIRERVKNFVAQYGAMSDTPSDIAEFLEELVAAIAPQLRGKQPDSAL